MRVAILHNAVAPDAAPDDRDVLVQAAAVAEALVALGHRVEVVPCDLDLAARLAADPPDRVWNLVESLGGHGRLIAHVPALLDALRIPYAGAPAEAIHLTSNKLLGKALLGAAGLPVPPTVAAWPGPTFTGAAPGGSGVGGMYVVKSVWEHASIGLDEDTLVRGRLPDLELLAARAPALGGACLAEPFIDGREFNISVIGRDGEPQVLPPAEIDFGAFPPEKPRLVGYRAKWDEGSFEFHHTPRRFDFPESDAPLLAALADLARRAWLVLGLRGWARVDFRVDGRGRPFILEVNTNPCLSPDAGFAAALARAGITFEEAVARILDDVGGSASRAAVREPAREPPPSPGPVAIRTDPGPGDPARVRALVEATGMFRAHEIPVAGELVTERLERGLASGYHFLFAEAGGELLGYACFGPIACTESAWDLYWIAVEPGRQGRGLGRRLLDLAERAVAGAGGTRVYIETSHGPAYAATRGFYERCGYALAAVLEDFYAPGDARATYCRVLRD
jgi:D-alanine-D-alanine ligase